MITDEVQYEKAREELRYLEVWLERLHEELAVYEGSRQIELSKSP